MHVRGVVHRVQQVVEGLVDRAAHQGGKRLLGCDDVLVPRGLAQSFTAVFTWADVGRRNRVQHFAGAAAMFVNAVGVAIKNFEDRQRLAFPRQFQRHVIGGRQRHHRMEANIVLAAKSPRVGQRSGGQQRAQVVAAAQPFDQHWQ